VLIITGPRQVGKTSLLDHLREPARSYVTLDDMNARGLAKTDPALFLQRFRPPVLIDEVQYAPELFPAIKLIVDQWPDPGAVWLTGSQSLPLMKGISESLAGRFCILNLLSFSARAMSGAILETYVVSEILKSWWHHCPRLSPQSERTAYLIDRAADNPPIGWL
jgi:hypothetical protein